MSGELFAITHSPFPCWQQVGIMVSGKWSNPPPEIAWSAHDVFYYFPGKQRGVFFTLVYLKTQTQKEEQTHTNTVHEYL